MPRIFKFEVSENEDSDTVEFRPKRETSLSAANIRNSRMRDLGCILELGDDLRLSEYATIMFLKQYGVVSWFIPNC